MKMQTSISKFNAVGFRIRAVRAMVGLAFGMLCQLAGSAGEFPEEWYYDASSRSVELRALEGKRAPELQLKDWQGAPQNLASLQDKVVVIDFWATWCGPCREALPKNAELVRKYTKQGLVMIGVHDSRRGTETMLQWAKKKGVNYPLAVDDAGISVRNYNVTFWPTYAVIDRQGILRAIGLEPGHLEKVIERLLNEDFQERNNGPQKAPVAKSDLEQP